MNETQPAPNTKTWHILVVDDDLNISRILTTILKFNGYQVEIAHSGCEALKKLEKECFDCVLSDIKMPGGDGIELNRAIQARWPELPVVLMTAYSEDSLTQHALEDGAIAVLSKTLDINILLDLFSHLLEG